MQYIALSYVWGVGMLKPKRLRPDSDELPMHISKTIQHAMTATKNLGLRYLWADAVCIDQDNAEAKKEQIPLMDYIYEHAFATIVSLGEHASIGLPGVGHGPKRHRQLVAEFGPVRMFSRCPTLSSEINASIWSTRAWTYQEGLFSRRCIFFSQHQVYFHCKGMICTEDSPSTVSVADDSVDANHYMNGDRMYVRRNTLWASPIRGDIMTYITYLAQYICRDISYDSDAVNAFGAVISRMERDFFHNGFIYGIPRDAFRDGLLWAPAAPIARRECGEYPNNFPSWSWAGWKTGQSTAISYARVNISYSPDYTIVPFPLSVSFGQEFLFRSQSSSMRLSGIGSELRDLWTTYSHSQQFQSCGPKVSSPASNALYVDGPIMRLPVTYDAETQVIGFANPTHLPQVSMVRLYPLWNEKCIIDTTSENVLLPIPRGPPMLREFLVLRTTQVSKLVTSEELEMTLMMLSRIDNSTATRAGILRLNIEADLVDFWRFAQVRRDTFWII